MDNIRQTIVEHVNDNTWEEYIGRGTSEFAASMWQNPYRIGKDGTRKQVIEKYETYIRAKLENPIWQLQLLRLRGKHLGCWCKPKECHGDILVKILKELETENG